MSERPRVRIVMGRCRHHRQGFGLRFEEQGRGQWLADWAFVIKEKSAQREGYDRSEITGSFGFAQAYPGCPHCRAQAAFKCGCGKVSCWDGEGSTVICPWCGASGHIGGTAETLGTGSDR
jgi:hypothetical protein